MKQILLMKHRDITYHLVSTLTNMECSIEGNSILRSDGFLCGNTEGRIIGKQTKKQGDENIITVIDVMRFDNNNNNNNNINN